LSIMEILAEMGITIHYHIPVPELDSARQKVLSQFGRFYMVTYANRVAPIGQLLLKRMLDIFGALVGCIILVMITVIAGPLIKLESPGPIFFAQKRVGRNGRVFKMYKFRSMYADAEERKKELMAQNEMNGLMFKMENDPRITKIGRFMRKTSLDEFPQFVNILKGDMSLVGTRPPTLDEFAQYSPYHKKRLSFKPGLTGMWQVSGRSDITDFEEIVKLDVEYIDSWSFILDIKILIKTVLQVFKGSGAK
ncbi:MAG: exopolysaccharide biosynthesis polyprenyl glycosylphosphotransferase, partial [Lachnospiraceae bacterium]|nr:exopolysaccharide biosynthesis polyprenyl glycosylphosphotransferase [Lachnospiraceae bacterium]